MMHDAWIFWLSVTWKLLHSWSIFPQCSFHTCVVHRHFLCTADTEMQGHQLHWLRGYSSHWRNLPHLITHTHMHLSSFLFLRYAWFYLLVHLDISYPVGCCSPSQTYNPGLWSILKAYSSRLYGVSQCGSSFFLLDCWCWCQNLISLPQQLHSRRHQCLRKQQDRC